MTCKKSKVILPALAFAMLSVVAPLTGAQSQTLPDAAINRPSQPIKGQYIVVFKDSVTDVDREVANLNRGQSMRVLHVYKDAIKGFAAQIPDVVVDALRRNPNVNYIEQDMSVSVNAVQSPVGAWGLSRIDQSVRTLDDAYIHANTGFGVTAYIIDTGILETHSDFGGRVRSGYTAFSGGTTDCNGHGTHVAGTVGGARWGVAKQVNLVAVRVLDCSGSGSWSGVIAGIDWVAADHLPNQPAVANMSLGGGGSLSIDQAVQRGIDDGVVFVVAAGNSGADACFYSPARAANAITVGATTSSDSRASYSNWGTCLDVFAPGSSITSAWYTSSTATNTISGTSMASPHVAGVAASILQQNPTFTPADVTNAIINSSTLGTVLSAGTNSFNRLLRAPIATPRPPMVTTTGPSLVYATTARLNGTLRSLASPGTSYFGFCYSSTVTDPFYTATPSGGVVCFEDSVNSATLPLNFVRDLTALARGTTYYFRAYARNSNGEIAYGLRSQFKTAR